MLKLFETTTIRNMDLANRFVRSATWEARAGDDGSCTPDLVEMMVQLAEGEVGLIITSHAYISREGQAGQRQLGVYSDELIPGLREMTEAVHRANGKIAMQLAHAGCMAAAKLSGAESLGPSVMESRRGPICREMNREDILGVVRAFGKAAVRAKEAGFDAVQIHAAHGYLLSQFLSPFYNKRKDSYGGGIQNRARAVLEALESVKASVGEDFPVMIKMNSQDFVDGGFSSDEMLEVAALLEDEGIDAIELSGGTLHSGKLNPVRTGKIDTQEKEVYYLEEAKSYKEKIKVPLMLVGGIRSYSVAERLVNDGMADYISLCRPLIREPDLIRRWRSGDTERATCLSDNLCIDAVRNGERLYCVAKDR